MAQVDSTNNPNDPNNPNAPQGPNQPGAGQVNQPATSGGAGAVSTTGAGNVTGQVVGTANPSQPFQNISSYLAANAPQSEQLAGQVAGTISGSIGKATNDIANASQDFGKSVNAGYTPQDSALVSQVAANPIASAANPDTVAAFQKQLNDAYTGPTDFTANPNYANLESEVASAQSMGQRAMTPTGIQTLLQSAEAPDYTQGINNLDTLLLAQNPKNLQTIQEAGQTANTANNALGNFLTDQTTQGNAAAQAAAANAQAASGGAGTALTGQEQSLSTALARELAAAQSQYTNQNNLTGGIQTAITTGNPLTAQQAALLKIDPAAYAKLLSVINAYEGAYSLSPVGSLGKYLKTGTLPTAPPSNATAASADDYALSEALATLSGPGGYAANPLTNPNPSLAGTWNAGMAPPSFDISGARSDVSNTFSSADLNHLMQTWIHSGLDALDPLAVLEGITHVGGPQGQIPYGPEVQLAAQQGLADNTAHPGHSIPQVDLDALTRMANNGY